MEFMDKFPSWFKDTDLIEEQPKDKGVLLSKICHNCKPVARVIYVKLRFHAGTQIKNIYKNKRMY